jgi:hypothetical protein
MGETRNSDSSLGGEMRITPKTQSSMEDGTSESHVNHQSDRGIDSIFDETSGNVSRNDNDGVQRRSSTTEGSNYKRASVASDRHPTDYFEETAAELAIPRGNRRSLRTANDAGRPSERTASGSIIGLSALAFSILSLFIYPILFGAAGIVLGFVARRREAKSLGAWAIGIGALSLIVGIFIVPFF